MSVLRPFQDVINQEPRSEIFGLIMEGNTKMIGGSAGSALWDRASSPSLGPARAGSADTASYRWFLIKPERLAQRDRVPSKFVAPQARKMFVSCAGFGET